MACMAVNDAFVMSRWIKSLDAEDKVTMLADGGAVFAEESGLCVKTGKFGGTRLQRLAMIVSFVFLGVVRLEVVVAVDAGHHVLLRIWYSWLRRRRWDRRWWWF